MSGYQKLDLMLPGIGLALALIAYRMKEELILVLITISVSFLRLNDWQSSFGVVDIYLLISGLNMD